MLDLQRTAGNKAVAAIAASANQTVVVQRFPRGNEVRDRIEAKELKKDRPQLTAVLQAIGEATRVLDSPVPADPVQIGVEAGQLDSVLRGISELAGRYPSKRPQKVLIELREEVTALVPILRTRARALADGARLGHPLANGRTWRQVLPNMARTRTVDIDADQGQKVGEAAGAINVVGKYQFPGQQTGFFKPDKAITKKKWYRPLENTLGGRELRAGEVPNPRGGDYEDEPVESRIARTYGIDRDNPRFSARAVAMFRVDQLIGAGVTARTDFAVKKTGNTSVVGTIMEEAGGVTPGALSESQRLVTHDHERPPGPANALSMEDPEFQRLLSRLNVLDAICGQVDRHLKNYYVQFSAGGRVNALTGIDLDLSFPTQNFDVTRPANKYPGLPLHVDGEIAQNVLALRDEDLMATLDTLLNPTELARTLDRLHAVQQYLRSTAVWLAPNQWAPAVLTNEPNPQEGDANRGYLGGMKPRQHVVNA